MSQRAVVLNTYRTLARLVGSLPESKQVASLSQLREGYRSNADAPEEDVQDLIKEAGKKIAFMRITTPKRRRTGQDGTTRWVYQSGGEKQEGTGSTRVSSKVHTNWDGNNLDPCSVKRHSQHLKRMGFANNLHAKGLF